MNAKAKVSQADTMSPEALCLRLYATVSPLLTIEAQFEATSSAAGNAAAGAGLAKGPEAGHADPAAAYASCRMLVDRIAAQLRQLRIDSAEREAIQYALVAYLDELALGREGPVREFWLPRLLQMHYFAENTAGDGFFDRLEQMRRSRQVYAVFVAYLVLLGGFKGRYAVRGKEIELLDLHEAVRADLEAWGCLEQTTLSPAARPPAESIVKARSNRFFLTIAAGTLGLAVAVNLALQIDLGIRADEFVDDTTQALRQIQEQS